MRRPDILLLEGLNVLQPAPPPGRQTALAVSDFIDFSVYVDAATEDIRRWYVERFLRLRETAFRNPESYFRRYARAARGRGDRPRREHLGPDQRAEPGAQHHAHPRAGHPGAAQGARPQRQRNPVAEGLTAAVLATARGWHHVPMTAESVPTQPDDELTELAARLRLVVGRLNRRIRIDGHETIPPLQLSALVTVEQHGPLRLSELARREAVTAPTMSRVLSALDEQGLVIRTPDPDDARGVRIVLSERGAVALNEVRSHRTALVARRLARLDPEQRRTVDAAMTALEALLVDDD